MSEAGDLLRRIGWSDGEAAQRLGGISGVTVENWRKGKRVPGPLILRWFLQVAEAIEAVGEPPPPPVRAIRAPETEKAPPRVSPWRRW